MGAWVEMFRVSTRYLFFAGSSTSLQCRIVVEVEPTQDAANRICDDLRRPNAVIDQSRAEAVQRFIERFSSSCVTYTGRSDLALDHLLELSRRFSDSLEEVGIDALDCRHHAAHHVGGFPRHVADANHSSKPVEHDSRDRVDHRGMACDRNHIARGLDRPLLRFPRNALAESPRFTGG